MARISHVARFLAVAILLSTSFLLFPPAPATAAGDATAEQAIREAVARNTGAAVDQVVVELIAATTTRTGLTVACDVDATEYQKGIKVTGAEMDRLAITRDDFHPEWNYTISPRSKNRAVVLA